MLVSQKKNLAMLLERHCAHGHRNLEEVARKYGLTVPEPRPECYACSLAKPRRITHDKVSSRRPTRPFEGMSADAKGPFATPTPEGYVYFFLLVCLYSSFCWIVLARSQSEWRTIWPAFVARAEARTGMHRAVSYIITDGQRSTRRV